MLLGYGFSINRACNYSSFYFTLIRHLSESWGNLQTSFLGPVGCLCHGHVFFSESSFLTLYCHLIHGISLVLVSWLLYVLRAGWLGVQTILCVIALSVGGWVSSRPCVWGWPHFWFVLSRLIGFISHVLIFLPVFLMIVHVWAWDLRVGVNVVPMMVLTAGWDSSGPILKESHIIWFLASSFDLSILLTIFSEYFYS